MLRKSIVLVHYLFLFGLLVFAVIFRDPYLLKYQQLAIPCLLVVLIIFAVIYFYRTSGIKRVLTIGCLLLILITALFNEGLFQYRKNYVLTNMPIRNSQLGKHFIIGYDQLEDLKPLVVNGLIGGIYISKRNVAGKTLKQMQSEIAELQQLRVKAGLPLLIITADQEGGIVSHLSPPLEKMPALSTLLQTESSQKTIIANAKAYGERQGESLANLGISVNLSPVVDLKPTHKKEFVDAHTLIEKRAISEDPEITTQMALAYGEGLLAKGVKPTYKHFPGLARLQVDTHYSTARLDASINDLQASDWIPFNEAAKQSGALIMLGHVILTELDKTNPASFSKTVIQDILRGDWQYQGLLITDDLTMGAAYLHGLCYATVSALNAGADLLLISYDHEKYYEAMYCVNQAYLNGQLDTAIIKQSQERLVRSFKQ